MELRGLVGLRFCARRKSDSCFGVIPDNPWRAELEKVGADGYDHVERNVHHTIVDGGFINRIMLKNS